MKIFATVLFVLWLSTLVRGQGPTLTVTGTSTFQGNVSLGPNSLTAGIVNNACNANQQAGADLGAQINTCLALGYKEILISSSGLTISTQVLINNLSNIKIHGLGGFTGIAVTNGITGASAACAVKITGTSQNIVFEDWELIGNSQTGSGGNGNGVCVYGTGATPSNIKFVRFSSNFNSGATNGISGTGGSMAAAGVSLYNVNTISIDGGYYGGNQIGIQADTTVFDLTIDEQAIVNSNLTSAVVTKNSVGHVTISDAIFTGNGSSSSSDWVNLDGCVQECVFARNYAEGNCGEALFSSFAAPSAWDVSWNHWLHTGSCLATGFMFDSSAATDLDIHDNWFTIGGSMINLFDFNPSASAGKVFRNNTVDFSSGSASANAINWQSGTQTGKCIFEGNTFGSALYTVFNATTAIAISGGTVGCRVMNNNCNTSSGTLGTCVKVESGATNTLVSNTTVSGAGTINNAVVDLGTGTACIGQGCPFSTIPAIYARVSQKSETGSADANVLTLTPPLQVGTYQVCTAISVSAATSGVISWTLSWTDSNGNGQTNIAQQIFQMGTAAPNTTFTQASGTGNYYGCSVIDTNAGAGNIVVKWVGGGTTTAKMSATIVRLL